MAVPIVSLITRRSAGHRSSFRLQRGFRVAPGHALLVIAAGSVALWLLRSRQRRAASSALPPPGTVFRPVIQADADDEDSIFRAARRAPERREAPAEPIVATTVWAIPAYSTALPLPWIHRAEIAVRLGRADELRGIALEMQRAGQDIEAGLLENYALLLERSRSSRERILAEVTRMLRAATTHRQSAAPERAAVSHSAPIDVTSAPQARASFIPPPPVPRAEAPVEARDVPTERARPVIPMPVLAIGEKRRASR
jgi:hypothetical protein